MAVKDHIALKSQHSGADESRAAGWTGRESVDMSGPRGH